VDPMQFNGSWLQAFVGSSQMIVMSVASVLLAIMVALIPFIASRIVRGDIGSTMMTVVSGVMAAGAVASGLAFTGGSGIAAGRAAPSGTPPTPSSSGSVAPSPSGGAVLSSSSQIAVTDDSRPPTPSSSDAGNNASVANGAASGNAAANSTLLSASQTGDTSRSVTQSAGHYCGRSLAGLAAWQAGHAIGRTMRWAGMGAEQ